MHIIHKEVHILSIIFFDDFMESKCLDPCKVVSFKFQNSTQLGYTMQFIDLNLAIMYKLSHFFFRLNKHLKLAKQWAYIAIENVISSSFFYFSGKLYPSGMIFIPNKLDPKKSTFLWYFAVDLKVNKYAISVK